MHLLLGQKEFIWDDVTFKRILSSFLLWKKKKKAASYIFTYTICIMTLLVIDARKTRTLKFYYRHRVFDFIGHDHCL